MRAEEFYVEWSGEDDGEYVSMEFDDFVDHLSRFAEAYAEQKNKELERISLTQQDVLTLQDKEIDKLKQENKELREWIRKRKETTAYCKSCNAHSKAEMPTHGLDERIYENCILCGK